jgi:hypothetical protein
MPLATPPAPGATWLVVLVGLLLLVVGVLVGIRLARWVLRYRVGRTRRTGARGEARALRLLAAAGWQVVEREVTAEGVVRVDREDRTYLVRADALVRKRRRVCVAEFKGGRGSATIAHRATRRQLLEYTLLFEVDGALLVDADAGRIHEVDFPAL